MLTIFHLLKKQWKRFKIISNEIELIWLISPSFCPIEPSFYTALCDKGMIYTIEKKRKEIRKASISFSLLFLAFLSILNLSYFINSFYTFDPPNATVRVEWKQRNEMRNFPIHEMINLRVWHALMIQLYSL